jgi:hypothetical protein
MIFRALRESGLADLRSVRHLEEQGDMLPEGGRKLVLVSVG